MATNQHALLRQWHMLRLIPRAPAKISVQDLQARLKDNEFGVHARTLQRDLIELSAAFPLTVDESVKPYGWSWHKDGGSFDLPGLGVPEALMLTMVDQYLQNHLPPSTLDALQPYFRTATQALANVSGNAHSKNWQNKVRTVSPTQPLMAPVIDEVSQRIVYEALMQELQLRLVYKKRGAQTPVVYEAVHPLAIVQRGKLIYLVCRLGEHADERILALHRVVEAVKLYLPARIGLQYSIDAYIRSGAFGFGKGGDLTLQANFTRACVEHLTETPLSADQALADLPDGRVELKATVSDSKELMWWLLGLGDGVEVVQPDALRQQMKETTARMAKLYD